jgi:hypothetical protein
MAGGYTTVHMFVDGLVNLYTRDIEGDCTFAAIFLAL